ncbi:MAG TPA: AarF/ABC1/UbiB kinase family protein [Blastocatellia bacterium]|nr:AarF/ABC1/UbiB kinase family protein [Blastocatellia bacterium]
MAFLAVAKDNHLRRYRQIAETLTKHGFGYLLAVLGMERFLTFHQELLGEVIGGSTLTPPQHIRLAMEELGTTFIKLGQLLSTRSDLLPPEYISEFARLQDEAPAIPSDLARETIESEFGRSIAELFAEFESEPLAAASIGQAHAAVLPDGSEVVIKVRRPGVVEQVEEDLEILHNLAAAASRRWEFVKRYDLLGLVQEFSLSLRGELDYIREGQNAEKFAAHFADDLSVHIPRVYWETTTSRILTIERIRGIKASDTAMLDRCEIDRTTLAEQGARVILKMVFEHGFFHADPHPGNFFIEPDGRFGLIDFGMVGTVDEKTQDYLANLILAMSKQDYDRFVESVLELDVTKQRVNRVELKRDFERMIKPFYGLPLGKVPLAPLLYDAFAIIRRHRLHLPPNLALLVKTIIITEGIGTHLDPNFHLTSVIEPYTERLMLRLFSPARLARKLGQSSLDLARLGIEVPRQLRRLLSEIERGGFEVGMKRDSFVPLIDRLEQLANRIVLGVIAAAFIVGLSVLLSVYRPPGWERWAGRMFAVGFLFAAVLGGYLAWSILRPTRSKHD